MTQVGPMRAASGAVDDEWVEELKGELARALGDEVEIRVPAAQPLPVEAPAPPALDDAVLAAVAAAVDASIERRLPVALEEAIRRVVPEAVDTAVAELLQALYPPTEVVEEAPPPPPARGLGRAAAF